MNLTKKTRYTTVETLDVTLELTGTPVDVRLTEPVDAGCCCCCCYCRLNFVVFYQLPLFFVLIELVRFIDGS